MIKTLSYPLPYALRILFDDVLTSFFVMILLTRYFGIIKLSFLFFLLDSEIKRKLEKAFLILFQQVHGMIW